MASRALFNRTVRPIYVRMRWLLTYLLFERRYHLHTATAVELDELGLEAPERRRYLPTGWLTLRRILRRKEVGASDVFIDFGSGMGRVVFQAAAFYPLRRVIGVELSEQLNQIARGNIERNRHRLRCQDVELVTRDAIDYEVPSDVTIAFFNNPFTGDVFQSTIDKLLGSVDENPRRLRIIYVNPVEEERLLRSPRVRCTRALRGYRPTADWSRSNSARMYEVLPGC